MRWLVVAAIVVLGGCQITPPQRPVPTPSPPPDTPPAGATVTPLASGDSATSPWDYIALARGASGTERQDYLLDAIEGFLDLGQSATARTLIEQLAAESLAPPQAARNRIALARSYYQERQYARVESTLAPLTAQGGLDAETTASIMLLRARSLAAQGNPEGALSLLTAREPLLVDQAAIVENQETIWRMLGLLDGTRLAQLRADGSRQTLAQWADLALVSQRFGWNPHQMRQQLEQWRALYPSHPASRVLIPQTLARLGDNLAEYRKIALLLPMTSGFGAAAQALYDGFSMMYEADSNPRKPLVTLYDTGENAELVGFYYQAAVREGAELVIGPLGKMAVDALVAGTELTVPTLLLGNTDQALGLRRNVFQFGLSPEDEARQLANRAFAEGLRVAAVLYPRTDWGVRQHDAFAERWQALGGVVAESSVYQENGSDHSQAIKLMLNLDESEGRHRELERLVGQDLEFVPKRREDLDFVFMIARSDQGRLLKPQIDFHKGQDLPVYAISQVYGGGDPVKDIDLASVVFGDMPWLLGGTGVHRAIRDQLPEGDRYRDQPLDRLFALGIDAYQLLFRLEAMKTNPQLEFPGTTGVLSLGPDGNIVRRLMWARFTEGGVEPLRFDTALTGPGPAAPR